MVILDQIFYERSYKVKDYLFADRLLDTMYVGVLRSLNGIPDFYACNHADWMNEYTSKQLCFLDPIIKESLLIPETYQETLLSWDSKKNYKNFLDYRNSFIGKVKGFSKILKRDVSDGLETLVIGIGLYPEHIPPHKFLNLNISFNEIEQKLKNFIKEYPL